MRSEKPISASPRLSEVSTTLYMKQFKSSSDWRWPSLVLSQGRSCNAFSFRASLLQAVGGAVSLAYRWLRWAPPVALCFQPSSGTLSFPPSCPISVTAVTGCADRWPSAKLPPLSRCVKQLLFHKGTPACLWKTGSGTEMDEPRLYWAVFWRKLESAAVILY